MTRSFLTLSSLKIGLAVSLVALALVAVASPFSSNTGAFFNSAMAAISNPIGAGDWSPPAQPLFWVEENQTQVNVEWLAVTDAAKYNVYRSSDNASFTLLTSVTAPTLAYEDTSVSNDTQYFYKVTASDAADNESEPADVAGKRAVTKDIVIDDNSMAGDYQTSGAVSSTGVWDAYTTQVGGYTTNVLQNAVGGDDFSTAYEAAGQTYTWQTNANLNGSYDVFVQYICDANRGVARYDVKAGAATLNASQLEIYQNRTDGTSSSSPCPVQATISEAGANWVKLGTFSFADVAGSVTLTANTGEHFILADAVAFHRVGDLASTPMSMGFETAETQSSAPRPSDVAVAPYGYCPVITKDASLNSGGSGVQILKWTSVAGATKYRLDGFSWNGSSWTQAYDNFDLPIGDSTVSISGGVVTYSTAASNPGKYAYKVEALNDANVVLGSTADIEVSTSCTFSVDRSAPGSSLAVIDGATQDVENRVQNGGFESGLAGWTKVGDVQIVAGSENGVTPMGANMVRIGDQTSDVSTDGKSVDVNILSQSIAHTSSGNGVKSLGFWYNFGTYEDANSFDKPGFMVFVGDKMVHQVWASDIPGFDADSSTLNQTGWRFLSIDVSHISNPTLSLAFYAGNSGDLKRQSFVYVDNMTTNEVAIKPSASFTINAADNVAVDQVHYEYKVGGSSVAGSGANGLNFTLTGQPDDGVVEYWASDTAGNVEPRRSFHALLDSSAPAAINDLSVTDDSNGTFTLNWSAPSDSNPYGVDQAAEYDVRYSTTPILSTISETDWAALSKPSVYNADGLPGGSFRAPLLASKAESYAVHVNNGPATYYFAVRAKDQAGNISFLLDTGSIVSATVASTEAYQAGDVVINEVMWMGSSSDSADEWLELRNMTDKDIDVNGWVIDGAQAGSDAYTFPSSTILPASGYIVIAKQSAALSALKTAPTVVANDLDLDDAGEQLTLKTSTSGTVIDQTMSGAWSAGENTANKRSMERNNIPGAGTASSDWHTCDSASCEEARDLHWKSVTTNYGTPGTANLSFDNSQIISTVELKAGDEDHVEIKAKGLSDMTKLTYTITYEHQVEGGTVTDAINGSQDLVLGTREWSSAALFLGTCSSNAENCVTHAPVENVKITVELVNSKGESKTITGSLK